MTPAKPKNPTRQVRRGKGHSYYADDVKVPGVTTLLNGIPKPALVNWAARVTAEEAVNRWDEFAAMPVGRRIAALERARYDITSEASERGKEVHALAHRLAIGDEVDVPEELSGYIKSLFAFLKDFDVDEELVEVIIVKRTAWGTYMGQFDALAALGVFAGERWLIDYKTGKGVYSEAAHQLAAYNDADTYLDADGTEQPFEAADRLGVVHLRQDGYELRPVNPEPDGALPSLAVFAYAAQIKRYLDDVEEDRGLYIGESIRPPRKA